MSSCSFGLLQMPILKNMGNILFRQSEKGKPFIYFENNNKSRTRGHSIDRIIHSE